MRKSLSIVIPVYNGAATISKTIEEIIKFFSNKSSGAVFLSEIILINDGSKDDSEKVIREIISKETSNIKLCYFSNETNSGKGYSIKRGIMEASGDIMIFTDTDLPYGCQIILEMAEKLASSRTEIAIGDRTLLKGAYEKYGKSRHLTSRVFSLITRNIVPSFPDTLCGLKGFVKAMGKRIFNKVECKGFSFDVEMLAIASKNKISVLRMPVIFNPIIDPGAENKSMFSLKKRAQVLRDLLIIWKKASAGEYLFE